MITPILNNSLMGNNEEVHLLSINEIQQTYSTANNSQATSNNCNLFETSNLHLEDYDMINEENLHIPSDISDAFSPRTLENIDKILSCQKSIETTDFLTSNQQLCNGDRLNFKSNEEESTQETQRLSSMNSTSTESFVMLESQEIQSQSSTISTSIKSLTNTLPKSVFKTYGDEMLIYEVVESGKRIWRAKYVGKECHEHDYDVLSETNDDELTLYDIRKKIFIRISAAGFLFFGHTPLPNRLFNTGEWVEFRVWKVYAKQIYFKCVTIENNEMTANWEEYKDGEKTNVSFSYVSSDCDELILRSKTDSSLLKLNSKELCKKALTEAEYKHIYYGTWELSIKGADQAKWRPVWKTPFSQLSFFKTRDNRWFEKFSNKKKPEHVYKEWLTSEKEVILFDIDRNVFVKLTEQGGLSGNSPNQMHLPFNETSTWCSNCIWKMMEKENYFIKTSDKNWTSVVDGEPLSIEYEFVDNEDDELILKNKLDSSYVKLNSHALFLKASKNDNYIEQGKGTWTELEDSNGEIHSLTKLLAKTLAKMVSDKMSQLKTNALLGSK
jgi:hypothetical protein